MNSDVDSRQQQNIEFVRISQRVCQLFHNPPQAAGPSLLVGNPALPAQDLAALIALAKAKPDALSIAIAASAHRCTSPASSLS